MIFDVNCKSTRDSCLINNQRQFNSRGAPNDISPVIMIIFKGNRWYSFSNRGIVLTLRLQLFGIIVFMESIFEVEYRN